MLKISFLGACNEVARASILIDDGIERILLDYGSNITEIPPLHPRKINKPLDAVFLTHAHLDHSGSLPLLISQGQKMPIYAMEVTKRLTRLLLLDSVKIAKREGYRLGYGKKEVRRTMKMFSNIKYREPIKFSSIEIIGYDAGHIPGSMGFLVKVDGKNVFFTGDYKDIDTQLLTKADFDELPEIDILITESTYAKREHPDRKRLEHEFIDFIDETCSNDGIALVSSFAVGRAQEILMILRKYKVKWPVWLDGMGKKATRIIMEYPELLKDYDGLKKAVKKVRFISSIADRKRALKQPGIIVTSAGMLGGGPVVWYLKHLYDRRDSSLILTGYQVKGTPGRMLLDTGRFVNDEIDVKVKMSVKWFDFSAHVGRSGLFRTVEKLQPKKIFCIHGEDTFGFAEELREMGYDAIAPGYVGETFTIK
ncbi:MAG: MBL fold metallo-hydrolase [Candidatus Aenigmarchaeota archaeon]|nr:MBL fold metallo-hydrolase [Candidatus Aenigmarchaeota archaeon]